MSLFYPLAQLPLGIVSGILDKFVNAILNGLVEGPGDMAAIMTNEVQMAAIRGELRNALVSWTTSDLPGARSSTMEPRRLTVVAHSGGATVALDVLTDDSLWHEWATAGTTPDVLSLITVGSSMNMSWRIDAKHRIFKPLRKSIKWVDIWARYDPVPHGPVKLAVREKIATVEQFRSVRVANHDNPFSDHSAYWGNHPEVVTRIVHEITGIAPDEGADEAPLAKAIHTGLKHIKAHRKHVGRTALVRLLATLGVGITAGVVDVVAESAPVSRVGRRVLDMLLPENKGGAWGWLLGIADARLAQWAVGVALVLVVAMMFWQVLRLWTIDDRLSRTYGKASVAMDVPPDDSAQLE